MSLNNVYLNDSKCIKKVNELDFLGHKLSNKGINADNGNVEAILNFRALKSKEELRSFLGLVTDLLQSAVKELNLLNTKKVRDST